MSTSIHEDDLEVMARNALFRVKVTTKNQQKYKLSIDQKLRD